MNAAVRAVVRMGIYVGAKVYFIREVSLDTLYTQHYFRNNKNPSLPKDTSTGGTIRAKQDKEHSVFILSFIPGTKHFVNTLLS